MPRKPRTYQNDTVTHLQIRMPGWLHNQIKDEAARRGLSMNKYAAHVLFQAILDQDYPEAPRSKFPKPDPGEIIRGYLAGETVYEPCGRPAPCERQKAGTTWVEGGEWCNECGIRVE